MRRTLPAAVAAFAAALALTGGCGDGGSGAGGAGEAGPGAPLRARPVITPDEELVPEEDSGDLPEATVQVGLDCERMGQSRDFAGTAERMGRAASSGDSSPETKAIAKVCQAAAKANQGLMGEAYHDALQAEQQSSHLHPQMLRPGLRMLNHTLLVAATAEGDRATALRARAALERLGGLPPEFLRDACSVAADPATLPDCATLPPTGTRSSSSSPSSAPSSSSSNGPEPGTAGPSAPSPEEPVQPPGEGGPTQPDTDHGPAPDES
ncbi:hypothetical protein [Nonomuraea bangladeshensis]|uniref:hypothetical protein n=1 Tax=Nonomuraea bangladeshensis TaxID=404385 RepID=UPI003C30837E